MANRSQDSTLNSLRGKIWLSVSGLALVNCAFGLAAYLVASFVISDVFFSLFIASVTAALTTMIFGWWLSNEVLRPIDQVNLIAKSLERSPTASLPKTTGSAETDELLVTLSRNSQQLQNFIGLMDEVAGGNTAAALAPLQNPDRLSTSFQKLVSKVSESIDAKRELDALKRAIVAVERSVARMKAGSFDTSFVSEHPATKEISSALAFLAAKITDAAGGARNNATEIVRLSSEIDSALVKAIETEDARVARVRHGWSKLLDPTHHSKPITDALGAAVLRATAFVDLDCEADRKELDLAPAIETVRKELNDMLKKINGIREMAGRISEASRISEDLFRRANLVALNASVKKAEAAARKSGTPLLADELAAISERADKLNTSVAAINDSLGRDLSDLSSSLQKAISESSSVRKLAAEIEDIVSVLRNFASQVANNHEELVTYETEELARRGRIDQLFETLTSEEGNAEQALRSTERSISTLFAVAASLEDSLSFVKLPPAENSKSNLPNAEQETGIEPTPANEKELWLMRDL